MMAAAPAADAGEAAEGDAEPVREKTTFTVRLVSFEASGKIKIIKEVRGISGLGLKEV